MLIFCITVEYFFLRTVEYHSDSHIHFDLWVWGVAIDMKIFKLKIINGFNFVTSNDLKGGKGVWLSCKLIDECNNTFMITSLRLVLIMLTCIQFSGSMWFKWT